MSSKNLKQPIKSLNLISQAYQLESDLHYLSRFIRFECLISGLSPLRIVTSSIECYVHA